MKKVLITGLLLLSIAVLICSEFQDIEGAAKKDLRSAGNYYRQKIFDKALGFYQKVLEANPYHIESLFNVAGIYYEVEKDYETSYGYYNRTLSAIDSLYTIYNELENSDAKAAKKFHKKYIKKEDIEKKQSNAELLRSNCWKIIYKDGFAEYNTQNYAEAVKILEKLYELAPDSVLTVKLIANSYLQNEQVNEAIKYYELAYEIDPNDEKTTQVLANQYFQSDNMEKAIEWYGKAAQITPDNANNYFNMGICYNNMDNSEKALEMFAKTLEYEPGNVDAIFNAKVIAQQANDIETFLEYSEMEFGINGYDAESMKLFCLKLNSMSAHEAVIKYGEKWAELAPEDPSPWRLMFLAANELGLKDKKAEYQKKLQSFGE